ncbi:hypothetical protein ICR95_25670 (plasmid) [Priestia megaterium]|uniref:hypothetical protein n=1 Tax=Priestia megaterium TaxID=1404 RepID=UPI00196B6E77|nr:hypothetical protein [Priestia megaterium]QSF35866.1 hypothetical protein ICR95_25670 [Priestia megaterium]
MKKTTLLIGSFVGFIVILVAVALIFGRTDSPPEKAVSKPIEQTEKTQKEEQASSEKKDSQFNVLEQKGNIKSDLSNQDKYALEESKKTVLAMIQPFSTKEFTGQSANDLKNQIVGNIEKYYTKDSLERYKTDGIIQFYENIGLYSELGDNDNKIINTKVDDYSVIDVSYDKKSKVYIVFLQIKTPEKEGYTGFALKQEEGIYKIQHYSDTKFYTE